MCVCETPTLEEGIVVFCLVVLFCVLKAMRLKMKSKQLLQERKLDSIFKAGAFDVDVACHDISGLCKPSGFEELELSEF